MNTKFNKNFPGAYDFSLGTNKRMWGVWFRMPGKKYKQFRTLSDLQGNGEGTIVASLEKLPSDQIFLFEEDRVLSLN